MRTISTISCPSSEKNMLKVTEKSVSCFPVNIKRISNVPNGVIYCPFSNEDMVMQAMGINTARVLKGKEPLPIICSMLNRGLLKATINEFKNKELQGRLKDGEVYEKKMTPYIQSVGVENVHKALPKETKILGEHLALKRLTVVDPKSLPDNVIENIYVVGHGEAGRPHLFETTKCDSGSKLIADAMKDLHTIIGNKVKPDVKIKITACESADRETLKSFEKTGDISERKRGTEPLAKSAKSEANKYFPQSRVFGYHGLGISRGYDYISNARCLVSDFNEENGTVNKWKKASTVRTEF